MKSTESSPRLLDVDAVAELLAVSTRTVRRLADSGRLPRPVRIGGSVRWDDVAIDKWIADGCPRVCEPKTSSE